MTSPADSIPTAHPAPARFSLSAMGTFSVLALVAFAAGSGVPTPLYRVYQESFALSPLTLTVIFAAYVFALLGTLLTAGRLSDYVGRRPILFAAIGVNALAMFTFLIAQDAATLIAARVLQGLAAGAAFPTLSATILDANRRNGALLNSVTPFVGLALGPLVGGAMVAFAPHPTQLVYAGLLAVSVALAALLWWMPETVAPRAGARAALRPNVAVPVQARAALWRVLPFNVAGWALGGFYFALMPSLVRTVTGIASPLLGAVVVAALSGTATIAVLSLRTLAPRRILLLAAPMLALGVAITLAGVVTQQAWPMLLGTLVAGVGFGGGFAGVLGTLLPLAAPNERAGLLSSYYVISYLAFSVPAILAGTFAPIVGLPMVATVYGVVVIVLALLSWIALRLAAPRT